MRCTRNWLCAALLLLSASPAFADVAAVGNEIAVGQAPQQKNPAAVFVGTRAVVAWEQEERGIVYRVYDNRSQVGADVLVAADDPVPDPPFRLVLDEQHQPALAARGTDFAVVWVEQTFRRRVDFFYGKRELLSSRVYARVFDAAGAPRGPVQEVAAGDHELSSPAVVAQGDGFWVAWEQKGGAQPGVYLSRLNGVGAPGAGQQVGSPGAKPSLAASTDRVLIAWERCCSTRPQVRREIAARLLGADGSFLGSAFLVNGGPVQSEQAAVAAGTNGEFLVAWQHSPDGRQAGIHGQLFSADGALVGSQRTLASGDGEQGSPRLLALAGGGYLLTYTQWYGTAATGVFGTAFDANLDADGSGLRINQHYGVPGPYIRATALSADGRILAVWDGRTPGKQRRLRGRYLEIAD